MIYQIWLTTLADNRELVYQTPVEDYAEGVLEFLEAKPFEGWESFSYEMIETF